MKYVWRILALAVVLQSFCAVRVSTAAEPDGRASRRIGLLDWHTDYVAAYAEARTERKPLLIFFRDEKQQSVADDYEKRVLASDDLWVSLSRFVRAVLPLDTPSPDVDAAGKPLRLVDHKAFEQLRQRHGIVVIDLEEPGSGPYGLITSAHPFSAGRHYSLFSTKVVLNLPRGTLTQRALLYALRIHPDSPRNLNSGMNEYLAEQAGRQSATMASLEQVGHHNWGSRFQAISSAVGRPVNEVAASGNGETIVDAAVSCVAAWRSSPGHWSLITNNPISYGYDLVRGRSGQWYATGILAK